MEDLHLLAVDQNEACPWDSRERGNPIFVFTVIATILYPIGVPVGLYMVLVRLDVPRLARYGEGEAILQHMIGLYVKLRNSTAASRLAVYVGGQTHESSAATKDAVVANRARHWFMELSCDGTREVTVDRLFEWMAEMGIGGHGGGQVEVQALFAEFDGDGNGTLD